jgi:hypothetical protein
MVGKITLRIGKYNIVRSRREPFPVMLSRSLSWVPPFCCNLVASWGYFYDQQNTVLSVQIEVCSPIQDTMFVLCWIYDSTRIKENNLLLYVWIQRNINRLYNTNIVQLFNLVLVIISLSSNTDILNT